MVEIGNLAIEPQMNARDGRVLEVCKLLANRRTLWSIGKDAIQGVEGKRHDEIVK